MSAKCHSQTFSILPLLTPATHTTTPVPPATPVATARMHTNDYSSVFDEVFGLRQTGFDGPQRQGFRTLGHYGQTYTGDGNAT